MSEKNETLAAALFKVESVHHIHGNQCLCGFKSHVSRDRTKHLIDVTIEAAAPHLTAQATRLLRDLIDPEDCSFDHHGGCQAHGYLSLEPGETCPQADAKTWVAGSGS